MESQVDDVGVKEGDLLAGKFRIERVLGTGGMGFVVAARHLELNETVAIKFLLPELTQDPDVVARFLREAQAAVRIKSEHVARVIDVGRQENGGPYIVMEYLEGIDLAEWLLKRGPLPVERALDFVLQACEAIAAAHALNIVHRDLKPANLFMIRRGDGTRAIKVLDFGISKVLGGDERSMTQSSALLGSPLYMPPEQMRSARDVDVRSDVWSLGVILHELIAGKPPFEGGTMPEVMIQVLEAPAVRLSASVPGVPPGLDQVILRCLEKNKLNRYPNVGELALALAPFAPGAQGSVERVLGVLRGKRMDATDQPISGGPASEPIPNSATRASWGGTHAKAKPSRVRRLAVFFGLTGLAVLFAAGAFLLLGGGPPPEPHSVPSGAAQPLAADSSSTTRPEPPSVKPEMPLLTPPSQPEPSARPARPERRPNGAKRTRVPAPAATEAPKPPSKRPAIDPFDDR